jgi:hypothetical protein
MDTSAMTLVELQRARARTASSLTDTAGILSSQYGFSLPSFDVGTNYVPHDMLALIHQGESITPAAYNPANGGGPDYELLLLEMQGFRSDLGKVDSKLSIIADRTDRTTIMAEKSDTVGLPPTRPVTA